MKKCLVIGATGSIGQHIVRQLLDDGFAVRLLTRDVSQIDPALPVETYEGDIRDQAVLKEALAGQEVVLISLSAGHDTETIQAVEGDGVINLLKLAEQAGVNRVIYTSGMFANEAATTPSETTKVQVERYLKQSQLAYTIFKPGFFAETMGKFVQGKRTVIIGNQPHPLHIGNIADYAKSVSVAINDETTIGQTYYVQGQGEPILLKDAVQQYLDVTHPGMKLSVFPIPLMRLINRFFINGQLTRNIDTMKVMQEVGEVGDASSYHQQFPTNQRTFQEWLDQL